MTSRSKRIARSDTRPNALRHATQALFLAVGLLAIAATGAEAAAKLVFISSTGVNKAGCGAAKSPCATLQYAHDLAASGGEIVIRDAGSYGPVTITKSLSIRNDSAGTALIEPAAGKIGISINAADDDDVLLKGLTVDGHGRAKQGIFWKSGARLSLIDCQVKGNTDSGVVLQSNAESPRALVRRGVYSDNGAHGLVLVATPTTDTEYATIVGATATNNGLAGFMAFNGSGYTYMVLSGVTVSGNASKGNASIDAYGSGSELHVGKSVIIAPDVAKSENGGRLCTTSGNLGDIRRDCTFTPQ